MADKKREAQGCFKPKYTKEIVAKAVEELIEEYDPDCKDTMPTDYRLMQKTGASVATVTRWYDGTADKEDDDEEAVTYKNIMQKLIDFRRHLCIENIACGVSNKTTGWIFLSKQPRWGGFQDSVQRVENNGKQDIKITIAGADGKPLKNGK